MSPCQRICELALIVGAPLILAIVECFHPHPHDLLELDVQTWLWVHYAQIPLFLLAALAVVELVRGRTGIPADICRVAMFVFGVGWVAWDTAAGVATGILVQAAHASGSPEPGSSRSTRFGQIQSWAGSAERSRRLELLRCP